MIGDTWGIPGPTFLALFAGAAAALVIAAIIHRAILFTGRRGYPVDRLGPQQVAYLNGGEKLALYSSLAGLRAAGAIDVAKGGALSPAGPMPAGVTPLDQAVYNAAGKRIRARDLAHEPWVESALTELREGLRSDGLVPTAATRRAARVVPLLMLALLGLGIVRVMAGLANDKPVGFLILLLIGWALIAVTTFFRVPRHTMAARTALNDMRRRHEYLSPSSAPAYATYGAASVALGVGLFGAASLWALDPAFAAEAEIQRAYASAGGTGGSYGGSSSGGDSGGSSDGGGGGCGGGGCGG
ncbi:TIGR04222 domain-containing membrane protein [Phytohabitans rumicis]|uniref:TIGR04222 domain-containing membrane protein n=1 Tax=Phytohabitans rumicis TaxID=1076125 RepID=A0A6V8LFV3_9ACTN|nr:TIGR04222 domain-containing membrane protein [Phytohabitans rumicis]GFJ92937.1 hypothetical protein Prum_065790 [Phytohabitans rumicis]